MFSQCLGALQVLRVQLGFAQLQHIMEELFTGHFLPVAMALRSPAHVFRPAKNVWKTPS